MTKVLKEKFNDIVLVRLFLIAIFAISCLYIYFLSGTIRAVVETKNNSKEIQAISQKYQKLENQYFNLLSKINIDYAHQIGFVDQPQEVDYIIRQTAVAYGKGF